MGAERCTLVATLGGQPQVITFALDALLARGEPIDEVVVMHLGPENPRFGRALQRLADEFAGERYGGRRMRFRSVPVLGLRGRLSDIRTEQDVEVAFDAVQRLFRELKARQRQLHVCVAGGRRMLALLMFSAAQLYFTHRDRMWHLYTPEEVLARAEEGALMHVRPEDGVRLLQVPVVPWGEYLPGLRRLVFGHVEGMWTLTPVDEEEIARCQALLRQLTPRQREVLRAFAEGLSPDEVAARLHLSRHTVDTHKTKILALCRNVWSLPESQRITYHFLREHFGPLVDRLGI